MDLDIVQRMRAEEADLVRKLRAVRDFLAAYEESPNPREARVAMERPSIREKIGVEGYGEYGRKVIVYAMMAMSTANHPLKTRQLVEFLEAVEIEISGENKINAVGALLSRSKDIVSHGKSGWSLADPASAREIVLNYTRGGSESPDGAYDASVAEAEGKGDERYTLPMKLQN